MNRLPYDNDGIDMKQNYVKRQPLRKFFRSFLIGWVWFCFSAATASPDPRQLVREAIHYWRGETSYTEMEMTIHRPDWERSMKLLVWTRGEKDSLVRFIAPPKDAGNALLKVGDAMWIFTPKLNQIISLPLSMMAQRWMGSDFSYNDLAKSDQLLYQYTHTLIDTTKEGGHKIYTVESVPKTAAPVVWGKEILKIRDDRILLEEAFFDQEMKPVKRLRTLKIGLLGDKLYPLRMQMIVEEASDQWTRLDYHKGYFDLNLPGYLLTQANLRSPRPWRTP